MPADELTAALEHASSNGYAAVIKHAINSKFLTQFDEITYKLLRNASKFGNDHPETVKLFLDLSVDPNSGIVMAYCGANSLPVLAEYGGNIEGNRQQFTSRFNQRTPQRRQSFSAD